MGLADGRSPAGCGPAQVAKSQDHVSGLLPARLPVDRGREVGTLPGRSSKSDLPGARRFMNVAVESSSEAMTSWFPILLYHRVLPTPTAPDPYRNCVSTAAFRSHLRWLQAHGYSSLPLTAGAGGPSLRRHGQQVAGTFDDGYEDNYVHAWPVLKEFGFTASIFVVTNIIGGMNDFDAGLGGAPARMVPPGQTCRPPPPRFRIGSPPCSPPPPLP